MNAKVFTKRILSLVSSLVVVGLVATWGSRAGHRRDADVLRELKAADPWLLNSEQVQRLVTLADEGDRDAAWMLYWHFLHKRDSTGRKYLVMAAERGVPEAQCSYYAILIQSPDRSIREQAVVWLEKAAKQGYKPAEESLAMHAEVLKLSDRRHSTKPR